MPNWRDGLVEAFPIPEDRRPGYKKKKPRYQLQESESESPSSSTPTSRPTPTGHRHDDTSSSNLQDQTLEGILGFLDINDTTPTPTEPFRFFDLPSELRHRVYELLLFSKPEYQPPKTTKGTRPPPSASAQAQAHVRAGSPPPSRCGVFFGSKRLHSEASHVLYSTTRFDIFPIQLFGGPPHILDLPTRYLDHVANLKMTVGPSWTSIPKSWKVSRVLVRCLKRLTAVRTLRVFVTFDPSHPAFARYRVSYNFYTDFCGNLLGDVLEVMPQVKFVELDGNPSIEVDGPLVTRLKDEAVEAGKEVRWGGSAGWAYKQK